MTGMHARTLLILWILALAPAAAIASDAKPASSVASTSNETREVSALVDHAMLLLAPTTGVRSQSVAWIAAHWDERLIPMLIETLRLMHDRPTRENVIRILQSRTGQRHGGDLRAWQR